MSTVIQRTYRPQLAAGALGMIANLANSEVGTRVCETSDGIGFGLAVSQGSADNGCVIGGSAFIGVSVRDVTLDRMPIDPLASQSDADAIAVDTYPQYANVGVLSRGDIWVNALSNVSAGDALYYNTTDGSFGNSSSGEAAIGSIVFTQQPADGDTVSLNGTTVTFKDSGATGNQSNIGPTLGDTITALATMLNASSDSNLSALKYAAYPPSPGGAGEGSGANTLQIADKTVGTAGNSIDISVSSTGATASGTTLSGGTSSGTAVSGGYWKTSALAGNLAKISLGIQR